MRGNYDPFGYGRVDVSAPSQPAGSDQPASPDDILFGGDGADAEPTGMAPIWRPPAQFEAGEVAVGAGTRPDASGVAAISACDSGTSPGEILGDHVFAVPPTAAAAVEPAKGPTEMPRRMAELLPKAVVGAPTEQTRPRLRRLALPAATGLVGAVGSYAFLLVGNPVMAVLTGCLGVTLVGMSWVWSRR